jgi:hypothetical protein
MTPRFKAIVRWKNDKHMLPVRFSVWIWNILTEIFVVLLVVSRQLPQQLCEIFVDQNLFVIISLHFTIHTIRR